MLLLIYLFSLASCAHVHPSMNTMRPLANEGPHIPKIIHFVWVGGNPKSQLLLKTLESWHKYAPDWLIVEWNDDTLFPLTLPYLKQAYDSRRFAFVSDYVRLYAVYHFGGVYLDSDVELLQPIDEFLNCNMFLSTEPQNNGIAGAHMFGAVPGHPFLKGLLDEYSDLQFKKAFGFFNEVLLPNRMRNYLNSTYNIDLADHRGEIFDMGNQSYVYPSWYFCSPEEGKPAYAVHHFSGTWYGNNLASTKKIGDCIQKCQRQKDSSKFWKIFYRYSVDSWSAGEILGIITVLAVLAGGCYLLWKKVISKISPPSVLLFKRRSA